MINIILNYIKNNILSIISIIISIIVLILHFSPIDNNSKDIIDDSLSLEVKEPSKVVVDIKGEVEKPGVYYFTKGTIVNDALKEAILTDKANTSSLNLSMEVTNEMVINIPSKDEKIDNTESAVNNSSTSTKVSTSKTPSKVSLNSASLKDLMSLPGIGESKASKIIAYRNDHGAFKSTDELKKVSGIGDAIYAKIKDYLTI